jgi:hypothetical protein
VPSISRRMTLTRGSSVGDTRYFATVGGGMYLGPQQTGS